MKIKCCWHLYIVYLIRFKWQLSTLEFTFSLVAHNTRGRPRFFPSWGRLASETCVPTFLNLPLPHGLVPLPGFSHANYKEGMSEEPNSPLNLPLHTITWYIGKKLFKPSQLASVHMVIVHVIVKKLASWCILGCGLRAGTTSTRRHKTVVCHVTHSKCHACSFFNVLFNLCSPRSKWRCVVV